MGGCLSFVGFLFLGFIFGCFLFCFFCFLGRGGYVGDVCWLLLYINISFLFCFLLVVQK